MAKDRRTQVFRRPDKCFSGPSTLAAERARATGMRDWDKIAGGLWSFVQFLLLSVVAGLDVRFGWSKDPGTA